MLKIIEHRAIGNYRPLMEQVWRLRHEVFVEEKGWETIRKDDGREIDQFDADNAVHLLYLDDGEVVGYSRLLPTTGPHLLSHVYPELSDGPAPTSSKLWEWTRFAVQESHRKGGRRLSYVGNCLLSGIVEWGLQNNVNEIGIQMNPLWMLTLVQLRFLPTPLGVIHELDGENTLAVRCRFDHRSLEALKEARGDDNPMIATSEVIAA